MSRQCIHYHQQCDRVLYLVWRISLQFFQGSQLPYLATESGDRWGSIKNSRPYPWTYSLHWKWHVEVGAIPWKIRSACRCSGQSRWAGGRIFAVDLDHGTVRVYIVRPCQLLRSDVYTSRWNQSKKFDRSISRSKLSPSHSSHLLSPFSLSHLLNEVHPSSTSHFRAV